MIKYYQIPDEYWLRLHFVRPRFKGDLENVLLYMAQECSKIAPTDCESYKDQINNAIRMFPGNISMKQKTIENWRTEIPALFGFYTEDKITNITKTAKPALFLNEQSDLVQFFKFFVHTFQFPGGHIKPKDNIELIKSGVRFKPAPFILNVLLEGNNLLAEQGKEKEMSLSAEEATYCIFNDLRVTSGRRTPREVAQIILANRRDKLKYYNPKDPHVFGNNGDPRTQGDITRYAADMMDYMEIASLLKKRLDRYYILAPNQTENIRFFANDNTFFEGYEQFYGVSHLEANMLSPIETEWFEYIDNSFNPELFKTDISALISEEDTVTVLVDDRIAEVLKSDKTTKKDVGNIGEALIYGHERMRLKLAGYKELLHLIQIVDSPSYHPGYDIASLEGDGTNLKRFIEVKTTISKSKLMMFGFHMSSNEWNTADTVGEHYCVYRLMLSEKDKTLYVLRNPVNLYKQNKIRVQSANGMEISYSQADFPTTELLQWRD